MTTPTPSLRFENQSVPCQWTDDHHFSFKVQLPPGLYTFGVQADLRQFDWESLYCPLTLYKNQGQRTGPWDFDLYHEHVPLLPTWKIQINGRYLGLFYMQRPTAEDLDRKTLRGEFGFYVDAAREVEIRGEPYSRFTLEPIALYLQPNALDHLETQPWASRGLAANWASSLATPRTLRPMASRRSHLSSARCEPGWSRHRPLKISIPS